MKKNNFVTLNYVVETIENTFGPLEQIPVSMKKDGQYATNVVNFRYEPTTVAYQTNPLLRQILDRIFPETHTTLPTGIKILWYLYLQAQRLKLSNAQKGVSL